MSRLAPFLSGLLGMPKEAYVSALTAAAAKTPADPFVRKAGIRRFLQLLSGSRARAYRDTVESLGDISQGAGFDSLVDMLKTEYLNEAKQVLKARTAVGTGVSTATTGAGVGLYLKSRKKKRRFW